MWVYFGLLILIVLVLTGCFVFLLKNNFENSNALTMREKQHYQNYVLKNPTFQKIIQFNNCDDIAKSLKLQIVDADSNELQGRESCLCSSDDKQYYGKIKCLKDIDDSDKYTRNFRCYHEIVHYVIDVGENKQVKCVYGKDRKGETKSHKEQKINFIAAAIAIPQEKLLSDIVNNRLRLNDQEFIVEMQNKYNQPKDTIVRRINEVVRFNNI